jgi:hypothetical protein
MTLFSSNWDIQEETTKVLHLEPSFSMVLKLDFSENSSEIPGKFWSVVLEKDEKYYLDRSYEKLRCTA